MFRFVVLVIRSTPYMYFALKKCVYMMKHSDKYDENTKYRYIQKLVNYMRKNARTVTNAYGKENLPAEGPYVMFPNHQGKYDGLGVVCTHDRPLSIIMEKTKAEMIVAREMMPLVKGRPIDLQDPRQQIMTLNGVTKDLKEGRVYLIFPEGGYDHNENTVQPFRTGVFKCVYDTHVPVVPVALIDSFKAMNGNSLKKVTTEVHYMEPIYYEEYKDLKRAEFAELLREKIQAKIDEELAKRK